jgi:anaerobic magnesium-protoporphyrin IX monomethyl ester cyclase
VGFMETSRGCPARCVFCSKGVYNSLWRRKSPQRVVDEMQRMLDYGFREIEIVDDAFTTDLERAVAVCEEILRRKLKFPWCCRNGLRVNDVNPEFFRIARKAGLHLVAFGFETGDPGLLAEMKKGATLEHGRQAARWARQAGITVMGYFLMGLPGETEQTLRETIDYACSLPIDLVKYNLAIPLPGTRLHEMWKDRIQVTNWDQYNFHRPARNLYQHPSLDWDTLEAYLGAGYRRFYLRPGYLLGQFVRLARQRRLFLTARTATQLLLGPRQSSPTKDPLSAGPED